MPSFDMLSIRDVADVALQRTTHLLRFPQPIGNLSYIAWAKGFEGPLLLESRLRRRHILQGAWSDALREWAPISKFVPPGGSLCDIGCGHAFIDLVAAGSVSNLTIALIDIERTEEKHHDFHATGAGYSNLGQAKRFLTENGVASDRVALCNPRHDPLPAGPFDLVVSLLSAGFHYPISEYSEFALRTLKPGGALVFDCRKNVDQQDFLSGFSEVNTISDDTKSVRIVAIK